ncbi:putative membrane protein [Candidatus Protofrankia californiensis]|uniref:Putative membrane protein n=1 Tax=Candidatus Protofrankia californiensis TaxID=1839754 RepID=A0A1C3NTI9_9ACTN|nr:putative membrane protein [Candidatus Protofrankia californiensis]
MSTVLDLAVVFTVFAAAIATAAALRGLLLKPRHRGGRR